jgi:hypothetical protein
MTGQTATGGMAQPTFSKQPPSVMLAELAALTNAALVDSSRGSQQVKGLASLEPARCICVFDNLKYADQRRDEGARLVSPGSRPAFPPMSRFCARRSLRIRQDRAGLTATPFARNPGSAMTASHRPP